MKEKPTKLGRKRDSSRDPIILEAALDVLATKGYEGMTMDAVAAQAKASKATIYRLWASKGELVQDAIVWLGQQDVDFQNVPDTGTLKGDIEASTRPDAYDERRLAVITGLMSMIASDQSGLGIAAFKAFVAPWVALNRLLLERAVERGEIASSLDIELLSRLVPSMCVYRISVERLPLDEDFNENLINRVLLPAVGLATP